MKNYDYCLLKFGNTQYSSAELEMAYYELATMAGIRMMPSELYTVDGNNHFITKRFDRDGERKIYTQTLAAISPDADSYEQLIAVCRKLHLPESDCQEVFRRMVFNILANNTDDHNKNFSFIMDEDGSWRLSPAYEPMISPTLLIMVASCLTRIIASISGPSFVASLVTMPFCLPVTTAYADLMLSSAMWLHH